MVFSFSLLYHCIVAWLKNEIMLKTLMLLSLSVSLSVHLCIHLPPSRQPVFYVGVLGGQRTTSGHLFSLWVLGLNSGCQAEKQVLLFTEPILLAL